MSHTIWTVQIAWSNPRTEPPDGRPRVLASATIEKPSHQGGPRLDEYPDHIAALAPPDARPFGYGLHVSYSLVATEKNRKRWTTERKAKTRRRNPSPGNWWGKPVSCPRFCIVNEWFTDVGK